MHCNHARGQLVTRPLRSAHNTLIYTFYMDVRTAQANATESLVCRSCVWATRDHSHRVNLWCVRIYRLCWMVWRCVSASAIWVAEKSHKYTLRVLFIYFILCCSLAFTRVKRTTDAYTVHAGWISWILEL